MPSMTLGRVRPVFQGEYSSAKAYAVLDRVTLNGEVWECVKDAPTGTAPQDNSSAFWVKIGAKGPQGERGLQGIQGPAGVDGAKGDPGDTGPQGSQGIQGEKGDPGDTGPRGPAGEKGDTGPQGPAGPKGDPGIQGPEGPQGPQGEKGAKGDPGPKGDTGATGPAGADGAQGLPPEHEWQGTQLRFKEPDGSWGQFIDLRGPQGESATVPVATSAMAGKVKPQTGNDDGLELTSDGTMRVRQATATQRGSVLASVTAAAGAVPVGGTDGSLGEDWLKKAMDAANAAMEAADAAGGKNVKSYVIETWKDGSSWYRKWSDGFIEQGGFISIGSPSEVTTTFFVPFTVLPHISLGGVTNYGGSTPDYKRHPLALTTSYFKTQSLFTDNTAVNSGAYWFACGY